VTAKVAFVGDVHGNLSALTGLCDELVALGDPYTVFLGDYINKGAESAEVIQHLLVLSQVGRATLLIGNHEAALLHALDTGDLSSFLKMGGAMTIRSYVGGNVGPDALAHFRASLPRAHLEAIRRMPDAFESEDVLAQHAPLSDSTPKFRITAHSPIGESPRIGLRSAQLDTGCGSPRGRLTALLWPSLTYAQVDARGVVIPR
jgi:serine/threonine protein phosphatase 1